MTTTIDIRVNQVILAADSSVRAMLPQLTRRLQQIEAASYPSSQKMWELHSVLKDVRAVSQASMACKEGCSSCCHMRVLLSQAEADAIGLAIGVAPVVLPKTHSPRSQNKFGKATPCTFLNAHGKCAIYEHRPIMCINHVNMDLTPELCSFEHWERYTSGKSTKGIPSLGFPDPVRSTYQNISKGTVVGDIRSFFPADRVAHLHR